MNNKEMLDSVQNDIHEKFNIKCQELEPLSGGYQSQLYRHLGSENIVLKIFSNKRHDDSKIIFIENALKYQSQLYSKSAKVVKVYTHKDRVIQNVSKINYMLMDYFEGVEKSYKDITDRELELLGETCAKMHCSLEHLNNAELHTDHLKNLEEFFMNFDNNKTSWSNEFEALTPMIKEVYKKIDLSQFKKLKIGLTHSDFSNDNILFSSDDVRILDFDRSRVSYQNQDIGRAIMSYTFNGKYIDKKKVDSFLRGYNTTQKINYEDIIHSIKLTWIIEVTFWMLPHFFDRINVKKIERFKEEIIWLSKNWDVLEQLIY